MADAVSASVIALHQARPTKARTPAERARAYRERKKSTLPAVVPAPASVSTRVTPRPPEAVTFSVTPSRRHVAPMLLQLAALALAIVGMLMNGAFARSLGATEASGWLFLAIGVAAALVALVVPPRAPSLLQAR